MMPFKLEDNSKFDNILCTKFEIIFFSHFDSPNIHTNKHTHTHTHTHTFLLYCFLPRMSYVLTLASSQLCLLLNDLCPSWAAPPVMSHGRRALAALGLALDGGEETRSRQTTASPRPPQLCSVPQSYPSPSWPYEECWLECEHAFGPASYGSEPETGRADHAGPPPAAAGTSHHVQSSQSSVSWSHPTTESLHHDMWEMCTAPDHQTLQRRKKRKCYLQEVVMFWYSVQKVKLGTTFLSHRRPLVVTPYEITRAAGVFSLWLVLTAATRLIA